MALTDSRWQRITMLCALYFAQGFPKGFMVTAVINYLIDRGVSDTEVGYLTAIVVVPWTFKLAWAPLIDSVTIRSMGRRRVWIIAAELMMAASLLSMLGVGDLAERLDFLFWMFFIHNCFASLQDVATDALAVDVLQPHEHGKMNGLMWGAKSIGIAAGGWAMHIVIDAWGLEAAVAIQTAVLLLIMLLPIFILERPGEKRFPWSPGQTSGAASTENFRSVWSVLKDLIRGFSLVSTSMMFVFGTVCVLGWGIVEVACKTFYRNELQWESIYVSEVMSLAVAAQMVGAIVGGMLADRFGQRKIMLIGFSIYAAMHLVFGSFPGLWKIHTVTWLYLFLNPGVLIVSTVTFTAMCMKISWTRASATMFTIYMTVSNLGHAVGNAALGPLTDTLKLSYQQVFWSAGIVTLLPLLLLPLINPDEVDAARRKEKARESAQRGTEAPVPDAE